jgi:capsular exopolysaccharide synthesis family protein
MKTTVEVLERRWPLVAALAAAGLVAGVAWSLAGASGYRASAEVLVRPQTVTAVGGVVSAAPEPAGRTLDTDMALATSPEVMKRTLLQASVTELTPDELADRITVRRKGSSDVVVLSVLDTDPGRVRMLADHAALELGKYLGELGGRPLATAEARARTRLEELAAQGRGDSPAYERVEAELQSLATLRDLAETRVEVVRQADEAVAADRSVWWGALAGLLLGALAGVGLAAAMEALARRHRSAPAVAARLGTTLLARLPAPPRRIARDEQLVMLAQPNGAGADAVRLLRLNLEHALARSGTGRTVLVTSGVDGEGTSTTAANLAVALARAGRRVALVDLDLRRPRIERFFGLPTTPGLTDVAFARTSLAGSLHRIDLATGHRLDGRADARDAQGSLDVLVPGPLPASPGELVASERVGNILAALGGHYDTVVVDAPPLLRHADSLALARHVDGVLLVLRPEKARGRRLEELRWLLGQSPAPLLGLAVGEAAPRAVHADVEEGDAGARRGGPPASGAPAERPAEPAPPVERTPAAAGIPRERHRSTVRTLAARRPHEVGVAAAVVASAGVLVWVLLSGQSRETANPVETLPLSPAATVSSDPPRVEATAGTLAWAPVAGATGYEVRLFGGAEMVLKRRTTQPRLALAGAGLEPGEYRWYVWALRAGGARGGSAVVQSRLVIPSG